MLWFVQSFQLIFYQLEVDAFGMIIVWTLLFLYLKHEGKYIRSLIVLLLGLTGLFVWHWALIHIVALTIENYVAIGIILIIVSLNGLSWFIQSVFPFIDPIASKVAQNQFGVGLFSTWPIISGLLKFKKEFKEIAWVLLIIGTLSGKFIYQAVPFLIIGIFNYRFNDKFRSYFSNNFDLMKNLIYILFLLTSLISTPHYVIDQIPTKYEMNFINHANQVSIDENLPLKNEWSLGYWIKYLGYDTNSYGGYQEIVDFNHSIAITSSLDLSDSCKKIDELNGFFFLKNWLTLWKCN